MSAIDDTDAEARRLDEAFRAKAREEIAAAEALAPADEAVRGQGDVLADVLLVKGMPGPADRKARRALVGADGVAAGKALDSLELSNARYALCTRVDVADDEGRLERLRLLVEAVDPRTVVLLDPEAAADYAAAYGVGPFEPGVVGVVTGRTVIAVEGLEASLGDEGRKRRVWQQLRALAPADPA